jgi:hypothetical protein
MTVNEIKVTVGNQARTIDTEAVLRIDRNDLDNELARQSALYAWYFILFERARAEKIELEAKLEDLTYELDDSIRPALPKGYTETAVKAKIRSDARYKELAKTCRRAESDERMLLVLEKALAQRKDCLKEISRSRYLEMSSMSADEVERAKRNVCGR